MRLCSLISIWSYFKYWHKNCFWLYDAMVMIRLVHGHWRRCSDLHQLRLSQRQRLPGRCLWNADRSTLWEYDKLNTNENKTRLRGKHWHSQLNSSVPWCRVNRGLCWNSNHCHRDQHHDGPKVEHQSHLHTVRTSLDVGQFFKMNYSFLNYIYLFERSDLPAALCSAPNGCAQYFTGSMGTVSSYNHAGGQQLSSQRANMCVRTEKGTICAISELVHLMYLLLK